MLACISIDYRVHRIDYGSLKLESHGQVMWQGFEQFFTIKLFVDEIYFVNTFL